MDTPIRPISASTRELLTPLDLAESTRKRIFADVSLSPVLTEKSVREIVSSEMVSLGETLKVSINESVKQCITEQFQSLNFDIGFLKDSKEVIESIQKENKDMKTAVTTLTDENTELKRRVLYLESQIKSNNVKIIGLTESKDPKIREAEDCEATLLHAFQKAGIEFRDPLYLFAECYRQGYYKESNKDPRPIIVKFQHKKHKQVIMNNRNKLKKSCNITAVDDAPIEIQNARKLMLPIVHAAKRYNKSQPTGNALKTKMSGDRLIVNGSTYKTDTLNLLPTPLQSKHVYTPTDGKITAFFTAMSPLSNHHISPFRCQGLPFNCVEQYYVYAMAMRFGNSKLAEQILNEKNPKVVKALSYRIQGFNEHIWNNEAPKIMETGLIEKFRQNPEIKEFLMNTGDTELVEANGRDSVWSCGLALQDPNLWDSAKWTGKNLLGQILQKLRNNFRSNE